jgi:hypothetical protein
MYEVCLGNEALKVFTWFPAKKKTNKYQVDTELHLVSWFQYPVRVFHFVPPILGTVGGKMCAFDDFDRYPSIWCSGGRARDSVAFPCLRPHALYNVDISCLLWKSQ